MSRIFKVGVTGFTMIVKTHPKELLKKNKDSFLLEIRKEETEFLKEFRNYDWFQDALKGLDLTEEEWLENQIKAQVAFIERATFCPCCEKLFEEEAEYKEENICLPCAKKLLNTLSSTVEESERSQHQKP